MRRILACLGMLAAPCLPAAAVTAAPGYTVITATTITDASGNPLASGTATFQIVDAGAHPMTVKAGYGGQITTSLVSVPVTNGIFSATVADVSQTLPSFPCVQLNIVDNSTGSVVWNNNCLQPTGQFYSLDLFNTNTTPIYPQAGDTVQGNLGVNGNLSVTGNLSVGGFSAANLTLTYGTAMEFNGTINAALYPGSDIGAKVNAAAGSCTDGAPCHVEIPPGVYTSWTTPIQLPRMAQGLEFTCDRNATLTYTGTRDAISTSVAVNTGNFGGTLIDGGCVINGSSAANSGLRIRSSAGVTVKDLTISGFSNGDGVWIDGANAVHISGMAFIGNKVNIHATGNQCNGANLCEWDRNSSGTWVFTPLSGASGFAPNAIHVTDSRINNGGTWGVVVGDVIGGSVSQAFNNTFEDDTFEGNGNAGLGGAILLGFTTETNITHSYFEGNDNGVVEGCVSGSPSITTSPTGYTAQFCGTAAGVRVESNFFNDPSTADEVFYNYANSPVTNFNVVSSNAACLVDTYSYNGNLGLNANTIFGAGSETCSGGSPGSNAVAGTPGGLIGGYSETADSATGGKHFRGNVQVDGALFTNGLLTANVNANTLTGAGIIVGRIGAINIWQSTVTPGGACGGAPDIWFTATDMYICSGTWRLVTHN